MSKPRRYRTRFAILPGFVTSPRDGQTHFVTARELVWLYRIDWREAEVFFEDRADDMRRLESRPDLIRLYPRPAGGYAGARTEAVLASSALRSAQLTADIAALEARWPKPAKRQWSVMVDLETLGTAPGYALLSIGAVAYDKVTGEIGRRFYVVINRGSNQLVGLREDPATVAWWSKQSAAAREIFEHPSAVPIWAALERFDKFWREVRGGEFWAHGPGFDAGLLSAAYRATGKRVPWAFWNERCTRTIYAAAGVSPDRSQGVHHNALQDAVTQAEAVIEAYRVLGLGRRPLRWTLVRLGRAVMRAVIGRA